MYIKSIAFLCIAAQVSACGGAGNIARGRTANFVEPNAEGLISAGLTSERSGRFVDQFGNGYGHQVGVKDGDGFFALAGVTPGTTFRPPVTSGSVSYTGPSSVTSIKGIDLSGDFIRGFTDFDSADITLTSDFNSGTLTGQNSFLRVDGVISGNALTGDVYFEGIQGDLTGGVDDRKAVGAFKGGVAETIFSGGFYTRRP